MSSSPLVLAPEVLTRLHQLQQANRPVSVDEILQAANLNHLALPVQQPTQSKSADIPRQCRRLSEHDHQKVKVSPPLCLEKSNSTTTTLAERRRFPVSSKKLTVDTKGLSSSSSTGRQRRNHGEQRDGLPTDIIIKKSIHTTASSGSALHRSERLEKLEIDNAELTQHVSIEYLVSHMKRQNGALQSETTEAKQLQADFDTIQHLLADNNNNGADLPRTTPVSSCPANQIHTSLLLESTTASDGHLDWDLWQCMVADYPSAAAKLPHLVSASLHNGGNIPHPVRGVLWQAMTQSSSPRLETMYENLVNNSDGSYAQILQHDCSHLCTTMEMFKGDDSQIQQAMERLLTSYTIYDPQVVYCQELIFLASPLLMMMPEKQAFCVFVRLMETHEMRKMYIHNKQGLYDQLNQFQTLLSRTCPKLDAHLTRHDINPSLYASQWYLTLFASSLPPRVVVRIYDLAFAEGAVETLTRVAIALMQKNEERLLAINDFDQILTHLRSNDYYDTAYQSDAEALISDAVALSSSITEIKLGTLGATYDKNLENDHVSQASTAGFRGSNSDSNSIDEIVKITTTPNKSKRGSWFSWKGGKNITMSPSPSEQSSTCVTSHHCIAGGMEPVIGQETDVIMATLSQLQKDHSRLTDQVNALKTDAMDYTAANNKLVNRNSILASQLDKYQQAHDQLPSGDLSIASSSFSSPSVSSVTCLANPTSFSLLLDKASVSRIQVLEKDQEFCSFVSSLRSTGEFGALIATALTTSAADAYLGKHEKDDDSGSMTSMDSPRSAIEIEDASAIAATATAGNPGDDDAISKLDAVTQELLAMKLANFEMEQRYEDVCHENESLMKELAFSQDKEEMYLDQVALLEKVRADQDQEINIITNANERLSERIMAIKQTSSELHMEKLSLMDQVAQLERDASELKREKQEYLKPRDSFSEEVFAAHQTLFGEGSVYQQQQRQQQQQQQQQQYGRKLDNNSNEYQRKYVDSELRCRELEKLLAETKVKLAEYETMPSPTQKRPTSFAAIKGNSNIHGLVLTTKGAAIGSTAMIRDDSVATRASIDSMSTTTSKRSSVYSRLWTSITTPTTPSSMDALPFSNNNYNRNKLEDRYQSPTIIQPEFTPI